MGRGGSEMLKRFVWAVIVAYRKYRELQPVEVGCFRVNLMGKQKVREGRL
jgi:hypothetical protein